MSSQQIRVAQIRSMSKSYKDFEVQMANMSDTFKQEFIAKEGQKEFIVDTNIRPDIHLVHLFLNGQQIEEGVDFTLLKSKKIVLKEALTLDEQLTVVILNAGQMGAVAEDHLHRVREVPSGVIDGVNKVFTISNKYLLDGSEHLFRNGMLQHDGTEGDYVIDRNVITFNVAPVSGSKLLVTYLIART